MTLTMNTIIEKLSFQEAKAKEEWLAEYIYWNPVKDYRYYTLKEYHLDFDRTKTRYVLARSNAPYGELTSLRIERNYYIA